MCRSAEGPQMHVKSSFVPLFAAILALQGAWVGLAKDAAPPALGSYNPPTTPTRGGILA